MSNNNHPMYIDFHALQTLPPSNVNRDDTGSPKTARFGGVTRARVSSQAWKKAMRDDFADLLDADKIGCRTLRAASLVARRIGELAPDIEEADRMSMAKDVLVLAASQDNKKKLKFSNEKGHEDETTYLLFISSAQVDGLARLAVAASESGCAVEKKAAKEVLDPRKSPALNAVDIALFGRMVATNPEANVDASVQVAHAIGVGASTPEFDYFTAMDDLKGDESAGAGMIGTIEFCSSTLYRYATLDVRGLHANLGSIAAVKEAVSAFAKAFATSMPTGKQNTFANRTLPAAVIAQVRDTQPVSLVNAFEKPVAAGAGKSTVGEACERLVAQEREVDRAFGVAPSSAYMVVADADAGALDGIGEAVTLADMADKLAGEAVEYLAGLGYEDGE